MKVHTDICIIGAGPIGFFAVFQAGLLKMSCHVVDVVHHDGSQLATSLPEKHTYITPVHLNIDASGLTGNLMEQIYPFYPGFTNGESIDKLCRLKDGSFKLLTDQGTQINCRAVVFIGQRSTLGLNSDYNVDIDHPIAEMNTQDYQTIIPGVFAIGDYHSHSSNMASFIPGFIKASLVSQGAFKYIHPLKHLCYKAN